MMAIGFLNVQMSIFMLLLAFLVCCLTNAEGKCIYLRLNVYFLRDFGRAFCIVFFFFFYSSFRSLQCSTTPHHLNSFLFLILNHF